MGSATSSGVVAHERRRRAARSHPVQPRPEVLVRLAGPRRLAPPHQFLQREDPPQAVAAQHHRGPAGAPAPWRAPGRPTAPRRAPTAGSRAPTGPGPARPARRPRGPRPARPPPGCPPSAPWPPPRPREAVGAAAPRPWGTDRCCPCTPAGSRWRASVPGTGTPRIARIACARVRRCRRRTPDAHRRSRRGAAPDAPADDDTFPRQWARTQRLTLGEPRTVTVAGDGSAAWCSSAPATATTA